MNRTPKRALLLLLLLCAATLVVASGCTETVAFFSLELESPVWDPPLSCANDPRRIHELLLRFECPDETVEMKREIDGNFNISDVPLGECTIKAEGKNKAGRQVAAGQVVAEIARGDNPPIKVALIPVSCGIDCDPDRDGLASADELALGLKADVADTDGDGLDDGLELTQCCSDPSDSKDGDRCQLLIKAVIPPLGPAGESVIIKATKTLEKPTVQLGSAPLDTPLVDATTVFGRVGVKAVLGEVRVSSAGSAEVYSDLFAVLERDPEPVFEIDQRAGAKIGLMQRLVDIAQHDAGTFILGQVGGSSNTSGGAGIVIKLDRRRQQNRRVIVASKGRPVAIDVRGDVVGVLAQDGTSHTLLTYNAPTFPAATRSAVRLNTGSRRAISFVLGQNGIVVLFTDAVGVYAADGSAGKVILLGDVSRAVAASRPTPSGGTTVTTSAPQVRGCTGMVYDAAGDQLYVACNAAPGACKAGQRCPEIAALVRVGPLKTCASVLSGGPTNPNSASCGATFVNTGARMIGAPALDTKRKRVYCLTSAGVADAPLGAGTVTKVAPLRLLAPFSPSPKGTSPRQIAVDGRGFIYVANGVTVLRIDPPSAGATKRTGRPMRIGIAGEQALMLSVTSDSATLDVGRHQVADSLLSVCLSRCPTCACR